jgi:CubicO group peptidase (beta-lactamase class C family)
MMTPIPRRRFLVRLALGATATAAPTVLGPTLGVLRGAEVQPRPTPEEMVALAGFAKSAMEQHRIPGLSVAISRHGQIVYRQAFGFADKATGETLTPAHLFRIASVTKPITSVAIFKLLESGRLRLEDLVFGPRGLLQMDYGQDYNAQVRKITLHQLLTHTAGGWPNDSSDPMFSHLEMSQKELISWTLDQQPLTWTPGTHQAYSNFGYCVLGRVIEKISGQSYEEYVRQRILLKCGINRMRIGGDKLQDRIGGEVVYDDPAAYGDTVKMRRMDSHGGWVASAMDLVLFAMHVDGFDTTPNILHQDTVRTMTTPPAAGDRYACGWAVNSVPNWWHAGSLPGTASLLVRTARGLCWAVLANGRTKGIDAALDSLMWKMVKAVSAWEA